jgi:hypothetical protein
MQAALEDPRQQQVPCGSWQATRLFYKLPWIYLLTYTSNQNEKIMRVFAVLILVSFFNLFCSLPKARIQML